MPAMVESEIQTKRKVFIETLGCQMNLNDSELMLGLLAKENFEPTDSQFDADLIILNTCQIRANAEDKAFSHLGAWKRLKRNNPHIKIAMGGCVAQQVKDGVFKRAPFVDIVFGTQNIHELPTMVKQAFDTDEKRVLFVDKQKPKSTYEYFDAVAPIRKSTVSAWVTIIEGCDYFCTYCVVPYTRGRQISRPPASILDEAKQLADEGFQEVTLLGQTVDAYGRDFEDRTYTMAHLLEDLNNQVPDIKRIRFMTSHPLDLTDDIIHAIADLPHVMEYIHMPMQAGNDVVLDRMRRGYTSQAYYDLVDKIRDLIPNVAISGDYIVGFPGETHEQFLDTLYSVKRVGFDSANTAAYSARQQTPAGLWEHKGEGVISAEEKKARLHQLNDVIKEVSHTQNKPYADQVVEVLVEGKGRRKHLNRWMGRTRTNKVVNFDASLDGDLTGQFLQVRITEANAFALRGVHQPQA